jgi:hypothetical protein
MKETLLQHPWLAVLLTYFTAAHVGPCDLPTDSGFRVINSILRQLPRPRADGARNGK